MSISTFISAFMEPSAPPPPVVVLLDYTELYIAPSASLLAFEDLRPGPSLHAAADRSSPTHNRYHPYRREAKSASSTSNPPCNDPSSPSTNDASCRAGSSPLSSPASSPRSSPAPLSNEPRRPMAVSTKIKIKRPTGASRKNLLSQVKWEETILTDVKTHARALVFTHLKPELCFKDQDEGKLKEVRNQMVAMFPVLDDYENMWPLDIIIMGLLKYYSSHSKVASTKKAVNVMRQVVGPSSISSRTRHSKVA